MSTEVVPITIYDIDVNADGLVGIRMTLTSPACPAAQSLPGEVKAKAKTVPGVSDAWVDVVWEPTWGHEQDVRRGEATGGVVVDLEVSKPQAEVGTGAGRMTGPVGRVRRAHGSPECCGWSSPCSR